MSKNHDHAPSNRAGNERSLWLSFGLTFGFLIAEVIGGVITGSLALISDAAHMFTDAAALAIALAATRIARRPADSKRTFGYYRFEILAAAFNATLLFVVAIYILYEAWQRLNAPLEVQSMGMLVIACLGLVVNLISMRLLSAGKDTSLNVKGAYLEVWSDLLGSIGVIAAALIIKFTGWAWVDSAVAVAIGLWVLPRTWILLKESLNILLEGVPDGIDSADVDAAVRQTSGVTSTHDLHIWALSSGKASLSMHVVHAEAVDRDLLMRSIRTMLRERFAIQHSTIQLEATPCEDALETTHWAEPRTALAERALAEVGASPTAAAGGKG